MHTPAFGCPADTMTYIVSILHGAYGTIRSHRASATSAVEHRLQRGDLRARFVQYSYLPFCSLSFKFIRIEPKSTQSPLMREQALIDKAVTPSAKTDAAKER